MYRSTIISRYLAVLISGNSFTSTKGITSEDTTNKNTSCKTDIESFIKILIRERVKFVTYE